MGQTQQVEAAPVAELAAEPYADYELAAEPVRLRLDVVAGVDGLSVRWEALGGVGDAGMVAGSPAEVARAVGALVLRLAGMDAVDAVEDQPTVRIERCGCS